MIRHPPSSPLFPSPTLSRSNLWWKKGRFGNRCAGCHATAVAPATKAFTAFGLDCYACHGDATLEHTKDTSLMWLAKKRRNNRQAIAFIFADGHFGFGKPRSTGFRFPTNFFARHHLCQCVATAVSRTA